MATPCIWSCCSSVEYRRSPQTVSQVLMRTVGVLGLMNGWVTVLTSNGRSSCSYYANAAQFTYAFFHTYSVSLPTHNGIGLLLSHWVPLCYPEGFSFGLDPVAGSILSQGVIGQRSGWGCDGGLIRCGCPRVYRFLRRSFWVSVLSVV